MQLRQLAFAPHALSHSFPEMPHLVDKGRSDAPPSGLWLPARAAWPRRNHWHCGPRWSAMSKKQIQQLLPLPPEALSLWLLGQKTSGKISERARRASGVATVIWHVCLYCSYVWAWPFPFLVLLPRPGAASTNPCTARIWAIRLLRAVITAPSFCPHAKRNR